MRNRPGELLTRHHPNRQQAPIAEPSAILAAWREKIKIRTLDFPGITTNDVEQFSRGVLLRFKDGSGETPGSPDNNSVGSSSGGGGSGGCSVSNCQSAAFFSFKISD
jgi:hypothetical protein